MRIPCFVLLGSVLVAGCTTVIVPQATSTTVAGAAGSGGATTTGGCNLPATGGAPADTGNADGEATGGAGGGAPFVTDWATGYGPGSNGPAIADVAADESGDVFIVGTFGGTLDLGSGVTLSDPAGGGFLAKLDAAGSALWAREVSPLVEHVVADAGGAVWITDTDGSAHVTRYDGQGSVVWVAQPMDISSSLRLVPTGDGGAILAEVNGGAGDAQLLHIDAGGSTAWVGSLSPIFWSTPGSAQDLRTLALLDVAAAPGGGATLLVRGDETLLDDPGLCGGSAWALARLGADGDVVWKERIPTPVGDLFLATDALGNVLVEETLGPAETADLGHGKFYGGIGLAMFDPDGKPRWGKHFPGNATVLRPVFDAAGNILMAGSFWDTIDFGGGPLQGAGDTGRLLVVKLSPHGAHLASRTFDGTPPPDAGWDSPGDEHADAMALAPGGAVILAADYTGALDLGLGPLPNTPIEPNAGVVASALLARISP